MREMREKVSREEREIVTKKKFSTQLQYTSTNRSVLQLCAKTFGI